MKSYDNIRVFFSFLINMRKTFILSFCVVIFGVGFAKDVRRGTGYNILILNSYYRGYDWSDNIIDSIEAEFEKSGVDAGFFVEYMDTKFNFSQEICNSLYGLYKLKFADVKFDAIISSDNNALNFLLRYREDLFGDVPVVFCGVNSFEESMIAGENNITGVVESLDISQNLDMIIRLYPDVEDIVVICEKTNESGYAEINSAIGGYRDKLNFRIFKDVTFEDLGRSLREIKSKYVVLFAGFGSDVTGKYISATESYKLIMDNTDRPVVCLWRSMLGHGFLGGIVCDSWLQGELAAKKAIEVLGGKSTDEIAISKEGFNKPVFDYNVVKKLKIPLSRLPGDSILLYEPKSFYYRYKAYIWVVSSVFIVLSISIFLLLVNVFRRMSAEKALRESQRCLRAIVDSSSDVTWLKDEQGRFIAVNETYSNLCGFSVDEIIGKRDVDFWPRELAEKYEADDRKMIETGESLRVEEPVEVKDGRVLWIESIKSPIFDEDGKAIGTTGIGRDMTLHKEAEQALASERNLLRTLIDNLPDYIYTKDRQSRFTLCNAANIDMFDAESEAEVIGKTDYDFFERERADKWFAEEQEVLRTGKGFIARQESSVNKGKLVWASVTKVPLRDNDGEVIGIVGINTDITYLKNIEQDLQKTREELEKRVLERTSQLGQANENLVHEIEIRKKAEEMLLASQSQLRSLASELSLAEERLRRRIATDVHDDIGQNLAISKIKLEALRQKIGDGEYSGNIKEVLELITQTISATRSLTFEISSPVLYELGFEPAMEWLVRNCRKRHDYDAEFETDGKDKPMDKNIRVLLFQAVRELLVNVAKHAKASMVTVVSERQGNQIKIRVIDDGVGFDIEQAHNKARSSTGFGLFSIRERLGFMGGSIEIDSQAGEGTKVILRAPLV